jgi:outer membrane protein assembly factor BamB
MVLARARIAVVSILVATVSGASASAAVVSLTPDRSLTYRYPLDSQLFRVVTVRNIGDRPLQLGFDLKAIGVHARSGLLGHPQPPYFPLAPGESRALHVNGGFGEHFGAEQWPRRGTRTLRIRLTVTDAAAGERPLLSIVLRNHVRIVGRPGGRREDLPQANATLLGRVLAAGRPVPHADVVVQTQQAAHYEARTDGRGRFRLRVAAARPTGMSGVLAYTVTADRRGYQEGHGLALPRPGRTTRVTVRLHRATHGTHYRLVGSVGTGLTTYEGARSADGRYLATTTFHNNNISGHVVERDAAVTMFDTVAARELWRFPIHREMPTVAMTRDGSLIATSREPDGQGRDDRLTMLDHDGRIVWERPEGDETVQPMAVTFSPDDRWLAVGGKAGKLEVLEAATGRLVWSDQFIGSVRSLFFDADRLYADSGEGLERALDPATGRVIWATQVGSWVLSAAEDATTLVLGPKLGFDILALRKSDGRVLWRSFVLGAPDRFLLRPGGLRFVGCSTTCEITSAFLDAHGRLVGDGGFPAMAADASADGRYLLQSSGQKARIVDREGAVLWETHLGPPHIDGARGYAWMSPDGSRLVVGSSLTGRVYFYTGTLAG